MSKLTDKTMIPLWVAVAGIGGGGWWASRQQTVTDDHSVRITNVEAEQKQYVQDISKDISEMKQGIARIEGTLKGWENNNVESKIVGTAPSAFARATGRSREKHGLEPLFERRAASRQDRHHGGS